MADREANLFFILPVQAPVTSLWLTSDRVKDRAGHSSNLRTERDVSWKAEQLDAINREREDNLTEANF